MEIRKVFSPRLRNRFSSCSLYWHDITRNLGRWAMDVKLKLRSLLQLILMEDPRRKGTWEIGLYSYWFLMFGIVGFNTVAVAKIMGLGIFWIPTMIIFGVTEIWLVAVIMHAIFGEPAGASNYRV